MELLDHELVSYTSHVQNEGNITVVGTKSSTSKSFIHKLDMSIAID
jgi:hypothetical protein